MFELAGGKRTLPAYSFAYLLRYANVEDFLLGLQHFFFFLLLQFYKCFVKGSAIELAALSVENGTS